MRITCPQCGFSRDVPEDKLPEQAQLATCPKCEQRFRFRQLEGEQPEVGQPDQQAAQGPGATPDAQQPDLQYDLQYDLQHDQPADPAPQAEQAHGQSPDQHVSDQDAPGQDAGETIPPAAPGNAFPEVEVPFERLDQYGFFQGVWQTIRRAMLSPALFFRAMPLKGVLPPMAFYVLLFQFSLVLELMWSRVGLPPLSSIHPALAVLDLSSGGPVNPVVLFVFYPIMAAFMSFATSLLVHLVLLAMRSGERGYEATYRAMAYSNAPLILAALPYGHLLGIPWGFVTFFIGLKNVHRTSTLRVALAFGVLVVLQGALAWMMLQSILRSQGALP